MSYKVFFEEIEKYEPKSRGHEFEKLINKIFEDKGVLVSGRYRTADRQQEIDGAIMIFSKVFLLEAKWEKTETLAASKLFSFLGKINSKIDGTLGLFISYNTLSNNFISSVRNGLKQNCLVIHGPENIEDIIAEKVDLKEYVEYCFIQASTKNRVDINTSEFKAIPKKPLVKPSVVVIVDKWLDLYEGLTSTMPKSNFVANLQVWYPDVDDLSNKIINVYETIPFNSLVLDKFNKLIEKIVSTDRVSFTFSIVEMLKSNYWKKIAYEGFVKLLISNRIIIEKIDQIIIIDNVSEGLNGDWVSENKTSMIIEVFYDQTDFEVRSKIANLYLDIYCDSSRLEKFEQKKLANKVFNYLLKDGAKHFEVIKNELFDRLKSLKLEEFFYTEMLEDIGDIKQFTIRRMIERYGKILKEFDIKPKEFLEAEYDKL